MDAGKPARSSRGEGLIQGVLGLMLLLAVAWALAGGNGDAQAFDLARLAHW